MAVNYQDFIERADETALSLTRSSQNWTAFLETAARLYKYPYNEQLMIYSQRPDAGCLRRIRRLEQTYGAVYKARL